MCCRECVNACRRMVGEDTRMVGNGTRIFDVIGEFDADFFLWQILTVL